MSDDQDPMDTRGRSRVTEIYLNGLAGATPEVPVEFNELEAAALDAMDDRALGYINGAAGGERTAADNEAAFDRWRLEPEILKGVETRDLSVEALGTEFDVPVMLAPIGCQSIVDENGELASARAAAAQDVPLCSQPFPRTRWKRSPMRLARRRGGSSFIGRRTATSRPRFSTAPRRRATRLFSSPSTHRRSAGALATL
jgi:hypothetical protein